MHHRTVSLVLALAGGLAAVLAVLLVLAGPAAPVWADPGELYVAPGGDCGGASPCYDSVQSAVDAAAEGDVIKVATGVYTGVQARPAPPGFQGPSVIDQVVYVSKTVTIRGGYTTTNWAVSHPLTQPTTLDAQGEGRVIYATGDVTVTIEGLHITGGNAAGLGGSASGSNGGGVYLDGSVATINGNVIVSNTAHSGGGVFLDQSNAVIAGNTFSHNTVSGFESTGSGLFLWDNSSAVLDGNVVSHNNGFGGLSLYFSSDATLIDNIIISNNGSGVVLEGKSAAILRANTIVSNTDWAGGGLLVANSSATLDSNIIMSNTTEYGGGLYLWNSGNLTSTNDIIADNHARSSGGGLYANFGSSVRLLHATVVRNTSGDGSGLYVYGGGAHVALTNTILMSHTVGIVVTAGNAATLEGTLWGNGAWANGADWAGAGTIVTGTVNVWDDPDFVDPDAGDYHIGPGSAAVDAGVDAGVREDMDGEPRPMRDGYDIGADELQEDTPVIRYVAVTGTDVYTCATPISACRTVQYAVDVAGEGNVIKVATGVYTGVQARPAPAGYVGSAVVTQVVYISKTVTIHGGYTTTNWAVSHPLTQPTTLDAQGEGRVVFIAGTISPTIEGLRITGGDAAGLGGASFPEGDMGGGVYARQAAVVISGSHIYSNTTGGALGYGGGVFATSCRGFLLTRSRIYNNTATGDYGSSGGVYALCEREVVIIGNTIVGNRGEPGSEGAGAGGGGLVVGSYKGTTVQDNVIANNQVAGPCGGLVVGGYNVSATVVISNVVSGNSAGYFGGGLCVWQDSRDVLISGNLISDNRASVDDAREGGGVYVGSGSTGVTLTNNLVVGNRLANGGQGAGIFIGENSICHLAHTTLAHNVGGDGSGVFVGGGLGHPGAVALTNTIVVSQAFGVYVSEYSVATLEATLWGDGIWANEVDWSGDGAVFTGTVNVWGDPDFVDPDAGDYHIGPGSAAVDAGVDAGVREDMDGEPRPMRGGYDIGADELGWASLAVTKHASPEPVLAGGQLTYTIRITNTGSVTLTVTITDALPAHVTPTGVLTWTAVISAPGGAWRGVVPVTVTFGYSGTLTNTVEVVSEQGAVGYAEVSCTVVKHSWYLPLARREE